MRADEFIKVMREALTEVGPHYYGISYFNDELLQRAHIHDDNSKKDALRKHLARHGERVFCYKLYHRLRSIMGNLAEEGGSNVVLQAELRKESIHNLLQYVPEGVRPLEKEYIPDFLLHSPPDFDHQEVVVEVKANPSIGWPDIYGDISKLDEFISSYRYSLGLMLIINSSFESVLKLIRENKPQLMETIRSPQKLVVMVKQDKDTNVVDTTLAEFYDL